ncbi:MAG TPA: pitrilysin family protein [Rhizomicrobium sp.]|nr:pitrilysin family protein [Rhizomicrobium sp.]
MNLRRCLLALAAALLLMPVDAQAADVKSVNMGKGVQVWFEEDHTLPIISMTVSLPAGSGYDPAGKGGLAAFTAAMLDEGAGSYTSQAFQTALSDRGIRLSVRPDRDWTTISLVTLKENAKDAFHLLGEALTKPRFDNDAVARVRAQMLASLKEDEEDPSSVAAKAFYTRFFAGHPYGHPIDGDTASIAAITRDDMRSFARVHWVRGGMHIAVSGDIDTKGLKTLLATAFRALPQKVPQPIPALHHMGAPGTKLIPMPVPQPNIVFGLPALPRKDRDFIPLYVANYILGGGGFSSRLTTEVREKRGLTYSISTSINTQTQIGYFAGQVATKAGSVQQTVKVIQDTIADFAKNGPTQKELDDAKTYLTGSFPLAFTSNAGITAQLNAFQDAGLPISYLQKRNGLINAVTVDDIQRAVNRVFAKGHLTIVIAGSPEAQKQRNAPLPGPDKPSAPSKPIQSQKRTMPPPKAPLPSPHAARPAAPTPAAGAPKH